jgi:SAM-dependent methyltransferase
MTNDTRWLDRLYGDYDAWKGWSASTVSHVDQAMMNIEIARARTAPPGRVLEIGFGTGAFLLHLQSKGFDCWGVERRSAHDAALSQRGLTIVNGDLGDLPAEHFDLVCAMDVLEHLTKDQLLDTLESVHRILKPGGRFLARFPNGASPFGAMYQSADLTHLTVLSISAFAQACSVTGLRAIGGWNAAVSWRASGVRAVVKPLLILARRVFEYVIGAVYFGERRPLDAIVTVCAERPMRDRV